MSCKIIVMAAAAAFLAAPGAAAPAVPAAQPAQAQVVEIPFAPPVGRTLRYRLGREATRDGRPQRSEATFAIVFRRSGPDYVMSVRTEMPAGVPPPSGESAIGQLLRRPMEFRVTSDGEIAEMLDMDAIWEATQRVLEQEVGRGPLAPGGREGIERFIRQMRALPPEAQLELFSRNVAPIVAVAGGVFAVGEEMSGNIEAQSVVGSLDQQASLRLDGADALLARLSMRSSVSNEEAEAGMRSLFAGVAPAGGLMPSFRILSNETLETYEVSRETGLTVRHRVARTIVVEVGGVREQGVQVQTLELVR